MEYVGMHLIHRIYHRVYRFWMIAVLVSMAAFFALGDRPAIAAPADAATAILSDPANQSQLSGRIVFSPTVNGLRIQASVQNAPAGLHGFHIHEKGSCSEAGNAAGGHFNPDGVKHGKLITDGFANAHAGDLGNILINLDGIGSLEQTIPGLSLTEGKYAIANRAVILHAKKDDFSQPVGNAGSRIGCGQIVQLDSSLTK